MNLWILKGVWTCLFGAKSFWERGCPAAMWVLQTRLSGRSDTECCALLLLDFNWENDNSMLNIPGFDRPDDISGAEKLGSRLWQHHHLCQHHLFASSISRKIITFLYQFYRTSCLDLDKCNVYPLSEIFFIDHFSQIYLKVEVWEMMEKYSLLSYLAEVSQSIK